MAVPSRREPPSIREPFPKKSQREKKEEKDFEESLRIAEEKNKELEDINADLMKQLVSLKEREEMLMLELECKQKKDRKRKRTEVACDESHHSTKKSHHYTGKSSTGFFIPFGHPEFTWRLFHTQSEALQTELFKDMRCFLKKSRGGHRYDLDFLLDLLFFSFSTGLSVETIAQGAHLNGEPLHRSTIREWLDKTFSDLSVWARSLIKFISVEQWVKDSSVILNNAGYESYHNTLFAFVDGSVVETRDVFDPVGSRGMYNSKHKFPAFVFFIMVTPCGRIIYLSDHLQKGATNDKTHFNLEKVALKLSEQYPYSSVTVEGKEYQMALGGDKAYPHADCPPNWKWYITKSGEETKDVDEENKEFGEVASKCKLPHVIFDPGIARLRGVVERVIGRVKGWAIFQSKNHCNTQKHVRQIVEISCGIINWFIEHGHLDQL